MPGVRETEIGNFKHLVIADFSVCSVFYTRPHIKTAAFSLHYRPPESFAANPARRYVSDRGDVWSAACAIYAMAVGKTLFGGAHNEMNVLKDIENKIGFDDTVGPPELWPRAEDYLRYPSPNFETKVAANLRPYPGLADLLLRMLHPYLLRRCSAREAMQDPFFTDAVKARVEAVLPRRDPPPPPLVGPAFDGANDLSVTHECVLRALRDRWHALPDDDADVVRGHQEKDGCRCQSDLLAGGTQLMLHIASGLADPETALHALALLRAYTYTRCERGVSESSPDPRGAAIACQLIANSYRVDDAFGDRAYWVDPTAFRDRFALGYDYTNIMVTRVLNALDFGLSIASAADFITEGARANSVSRHLAHAACLVYLLAATVFGFPARCATSLEDTALLCLAAVAGTPAPGGNDALAAGLGRHARRAMAYKDIAPSIESMSRLMYKQEVQAMKKMKEE